MGLAQWAALQFKRLAPRDNRINQYWASKHPGQRITDPSGLTAIPISRGELHALSMAMISGWTLMIVIGQSIRIAQLLFRRLPRELDDQIRDAKGNTASNVRVPTLQALLASWLSRIIVFGGMVSLLIFVCSCLVEWRHKQFPLAFVVSPNAQLRDRPGDSGSNLSNQPVLSEGTLLHVHRNLGQWVQVSPINPLAKELAPSNLPAKRVKGTPTTLPTDRKAETKGGSSRSDSYRNLMNSKPSNSDFRATTQEAIISFIIWMIALVWSVGACWYFGYPSTGNSVSNISASTSWGFRIG